MNGWFHYAKLFVALTGCIGFMMIKYKWGIDAKHWFKPFPFVIAAFCYILHVAKKRHINPYKEALSPARITTNHPFGQNQSTRGTQWAPLVILKKTKMVIN